MHTQHNLSYSAEGQDQKHSVSISSRLRSYRHSSLTISVPHTYFMYAYDQQHFFGNHSSVKPNTAQVVNSRVDFLPSSPGKQPQLFKERKENLSNKLHFITKMKMIVQTAKKRHCSSPDKYKQRTLPPLLALGKTLPSPKRHPASNTSWTIFSRETRLYPFCCLWARTRKAISWDL